MIRKILTKLYCSILLTTILFSANPVYAGTKINDVNTCISASRSTVSVASPPVLSRSIDLVLKYRIHNGYLQYRRWDKASQTWYDPTWTTIGPA